VRSRKLSHSKPKLSAQAKGKKLKPPAKSHTEMGQVWGDYPYTIEFHPMMNRLTGQSLADNIRHGICRTAFMNDLQQYGPVKELFEEWGKRPGLFKASDKVATSLDAIAAALSMEHRSELFDLDGQPSPPQLGESASQKLRSLVEGNQQNLRLISSYDGEVKGFTRACKKLVNSRLSPKPANFVRDILRLRWPWVAAELVDCFLRTAWFRAFGQMIVRNFSVEITAPPIKIVFESRPGESLSETWTRLNNEFLEAVPSQLHALKKGKRPGNTDTMARCARWFYQVRIEGKSIRSLAAEYRSLDDRSAIQRGVSEAERLLSLTPYTWR